jgi:signal recognition particle subunit SRP54
MFTDLSNNLSKVFDKLTRRGILTDKDVSEAMREIRIVLLEADVSLTVVKDFIEEVKEKAIGEDVLRSVTPGQMIVKIVHDNLIKVLSPEKLVDKTLAIIGKAPIPYLMLGLQGVGKTTTAIKIARFLKEKNHKKVLVASLDIYRPAAIEQLDYLAHSAGIDAFKVNFGEKPIEIAKKALNQAEIDNYDIVLFDTAGRTVVDNEMMNEISEIYNTVNPMESLLVADAMMGQDAAVVAQEFQKRVKITGIVLTRVDGDSRGGAALSMHSSIGVPIKFLGVGEATDSLEEFNAEKIARRILGMGDILDLVDKASSAIKKEDAERLEGRLKSGKFDLEDLLLQIRQLKKMGGLTGMMNFLPKLGQVGNKLKGLNADERVLAKQEAILLSMTLQERRQPSIIKASRKKRIASGSGTVVSEVNRVLKQYQSMSVMMKKFSKTPPNNLPNSLSGSLGDFPKGFNNILNKSLN